MSNLLTLHDRLLKIEKTHNYDSLYRAVHASKNPFVINYFDACVDALAFDGAVIISVDLALDKLKDAMSYLKGRELRQFKDRQQRILRDTKRNRSIWCIYDPYASLSAKNTAMVTFFLDIRVVEPLAKITHYQPKNLTTAINYYKGDIVTTRANDNVFDNFNTSDRLDSNGDSVGGHAMDSYNRKLDRQAIINLKKHNFDAVADPKQIETYMG